MRTYMIPINGVTVSAQQDVFLINGNNMAFKILELQIGADNASAVSEMALVAKRLTATVTNGSGGAAATFSKALTSDSAATINGRTNDTSRANTSGSTIILHPLTLNTLNGQAQTWGWQDIQPIFAPTESLLIGLETTPSASYSMRAYVTVQELF